jgi:hypothetical protein
MAQAAAPTEVEGLFDKLHQLIGQGSHGRIVKAADQSEKHLMMVHNTSKQQQNALVTVSVHAKRSSSYTLCRHTRASHSACLHTLRASLQSR